MGLEEELCHTRTPPLIANVLSQSGSGLVSASRIISSAVEQHECAWLRELLHERGTNRPDSL